MNKVALITGVSGQDGQFLADLLYFKGYEVHGTIRRKANNASNSFAEKPWLKLHYADLQDYGSLMETIIKVNPDEIYNLAAQSHVGVSFKNPESTVDITGLGALRMLNATRVSEDALGKRIRFYQASSSEMFGESKVFPQNEKTPFYPRSPYACAKVFAHHMTVNCREAYGMHASCGILFNHESELRGEDFVTRKITKAIAHMLAGKQFELELGNLDAKRDWGYAKDYVDAMWRMLQQDKADDYVVATGHNYSVRDFIEIAFKTLGVEIRWDGEGSSEKGFISTFDYDNKFASLWWGSGFVEGAEIILVNPEFYRPTEVSNLIGNATKAKEVLGWESQTSFEDMIRIMILNDCKKIGENLRGY
jgi:GDPmannose 4,6-dehydratase